MGNKLNNSSIAHLSQVTFCNRTLTEQNIIEIIKINLGGASSLIVRLNKFNLILHSNRKRS